MVMVMTMLGLSPELCGIGECLSPAHLPAGGILGQLCGWGHAQGQAAVGHLDQAGGRHLTQQRQGLARKLVQSVVAIGGKRGGKGGLTMCWRRWGVEQARGY